MRNIETERLLLTPWTMAEEDVEVTDVVLSPAGEGRIRVEVLLRYQGSDLSVLLTV